MAYNILGDDYTGILVEYEQKGHVNKFFFSSKSPDKAIDKFKELGVKTK